MDRHAADIAAAAEHLADGPVALMGHSMGAYAALRAAVTRPELFDRLVLVDGGLPLPAPDPADVDATLEATLGPAILRLRESYPSEQAYLDFFRAHPALADAWNSDIEDYVRYDVGGTADAVRSRCREDAVYEDGRYLLVEAASFGTDLARLTMPTLLLHAPSGMFGQPPGLLPAELVASWASQVHGLRTEMVADKGAPTVATRLIEPATWPDRSAEGSLPRA
jgi:pimeloyl-ACP methyl ester carboxylesterase